MCLAQCKWGLTRFILNRQTTLTLDLSNVKPKVVMLPNLRLTLALNRIKFRNYRSQIIKETHNNDLYYECETLGYELKCWLGIG